MRSSASCIAFLSWRFLCYLCLEWNLSVYCFGHIEVNILCFSVIWDTMDLAGCISLGVPFSLCGLTHLMWMSCSPSLHLWFHCYHFCGPCWIFMLHVGKLSPGLESSKAIQWMKSIFRFSYHEKYSVSSAGYKCSEAANSWQVCFSNWPCRV